MARITTGDGVRRSTVVCPLDGLGMRNGDVGVSVRVLEATVRWGRGLKAGPVCVPNGQLNSCRSCRCILS